MVLWLMQGVRQGLEQYLTPLAGRGVAQSVMPFFRRYCGRICALLAAVLLASCASLNPVPKHPEVKLAGIRVLPAESMLQRHLAVDLLIVNPNNRDLSVRSIHYNVSVENIKLLTGQTSEVPVLKANGETPVTLKVSVDLISGLGLLQHFASNGVSDKVNYNFSAIIDFSAWLPAMHVDKKGVLPLGGGQ